MTEIGVIIRAEDGKLKLTLINVRMKIRYSFRVTGVLRFSDDRTLLRQDATIKFRVSDSKRLEKVEITLSLDPEQPIPEIKTASNPVEHLQFLFPSVPQQNKAIALAKQIEAKLCCFDVSSLNIHELEEQWIPETDEEHRTLTLFGSRCWTGTPDEAHPIRSSRILRHILDEKHRVDEEFRNLLSFYRKGWEELHQFNYVECYFYFFFFLEGLFGEGKIRTDALVKSMSKNSEFMNTVRQVLNTGHDWGRFVECDESSAIKEIIRLRGFFFHNTRKRKKKWQPDRQVDYSKEAVFIAVVCDVIVRKRLWPGTEWTDDFTILEEGIKVPNLPRPT